MTFLYFVIPILGSQPARAAHVVDGFGFGSITSEVWCAPNAPPALSSNAGFAAGGPVLASIVGPGLAGGCNAATAAGGTNAPLWTMTSVSIAGGGDTATDVGDLFSFVTPVSSLATTELSVIGEILSSNQASFSLNWSGSDSGTAQRLRWFEGTTLLHEELRFGAWNESLQVLITSTGDINLVDLSSESLAVSVPEPLTLLGAGTALGFGTFFKRELSKKQKKTKV